MESLAWEVCLGDLPVTPMAAGWCHRLDGHEFEQALGVGDGQGSFAYCSPWSHKELDMPEWLNWIDLSLRSQCLPGQRVFTLLLSCGASWWVEHTRPGQVSDRKILWSDIWNLNGGAGKDRENSNTGKTSQVATKKSGIQVNGVRFHKPWWPSSVCREAMLKGQRVEETSP